jgi:hypothetical protein
LTTTEQEMKTPLFNKEQVKILKLLQIKKQENGKTIVHNLIDKEGNWVQIEYLTGANKGNRVPVVLEKLK